MNHWTDPALYIAGLALLVSGGQALYSILVHRQQRKAIQFIELIAVEFAKGEASLDLLEAKLRRGLNNTSITSEDILEVAVPACRVAGRAMTSVSEMPAVAIDLFSATNVAELDCILIMADEQAFESAARRLHIQTAMNVLTRVTANMASAKKDLTHTHL